MEDLPEPFVVLLQVQQTLILICIGVTLICAPIVVVVYYGQRRHPILRARRPEWALLNQLFIATVTLFFGYDAWRHYPTCAQILFTNSVLSMLALDSHIIRCWLLLYNWNVSKALCSQKAGESISTSNWWLQNTRLASNSIMALVMVSLTALHLGCWLLFIGINGWDRSWSAPAQSAICTSGLVWFFGVWGALACQMTIALYLSYNMRLIIDAFHIRHELMVSGGIWIIGCMPFWFLALVFPSLERFPNYIIMTGLSVQLCGLTALYINLVKPLLMIWKESTYKMGFEMTTVTTDGGEGAVHWTAGTTRAGHSPLPKVELRQMLDLNTGSSGAFIEFLAKEFSVENWKFYSDVLQLRKTYGGWKPDHAGQSGLTCGHLDWFRVQAPALLLLENSINRIYAMYISSSAPFAINLGSERMLALQACFGPDNLLRPQRIDDIAELLCRAQDEIYELMRADSYERFKRTKGFDQAQMALV